MIDIQKIKQQKVAEYPCYRTNTPIIVDGQLNSPSWNKVPWSEPLVDIITGKKTFLETRVKLLWDNQYLYIGFKNEEPFVRASFTENGSHLWEENDVEVFIAGDNAYYELELNALNTIYEVLWIWDDALGKAEGEFASEEWNPQVRKTKKLTHFMPSIHPRGDRTGYFDYSLSGLKHAVYVDGELNGLKGKDKSWKVELALPWKSLSVLADGRSIPPQNGDIWRIDCSRFQHFDKNGKRMETEVGWTWNKHGYWYSHMPESFTRVKFSTVPLS